MAGIVNAAAGAFNPNPRGVTTLPNRAPVGTNPAAVNRKSQLIAQLKALNPAQASAFRQYVGSQAPAAPTAPGAVGAQGAAPTALPATQEAAFAGQRSIAQEQYNDQIHQNEHQQNLTNLSYLPQFRDLRTMQGVEREHEPYQFVARGMLGSGINNANLEQMDEQHLRQLTDLRGQQAGAVSALENARNGIERSRAEALARIRTSRLSALANLAIGQIK